jgi:hypothetical protein
MLNFGLNNLKTAAEVAANLIFAITAEESGIDQDALWRFIDEQIYSLPGTKFHRDVFTVLLTGSRATRTHDPDSDVDIDVLCPQAIYDVVHRASLDVGIIRTEHSFFRVFRDNGWQQYFGEQKRPHFSLISLEKVRQQFQEYEDVALWIWTHAQVIIDPNRQFQRIVDGFTGYPKSVLVKKIKYRWMLSSYWAVAAGPHRQCEEDLLAHATAPLNAANELLRLCFLVEGKPFPYSKKLMRFARLTKLGRELCPILQHIVDIVVGKSGTELPVWARIDQAFDVLLNSDENPECQRLEEVCAKAMIAAGVEPKWVEADFDNIDELLLGRLGPVP